jgi:hypothetical protein
VENTLNSLLYIEIDSNNLGIKNKVFHTYNGCLSYMLKITVFSTSH